MELLLLFMHYPVFLLSVIVFLLVAGCNGLAPSGSPTPTATPAPIPADAPTATAIHVRAPGVTTNGVQNASVLVSAHNAVLANTSHTITVTETHRYANGTLQWRYEGHRLVAPTESRHYTTASIEGTGHGIGSLPDVTRIETYRDGQQVYGIESNGTTTSYFRTTAAADTLVGPVPLLVVFSTTDTQVTRTGTGLYHINTTRVTNPNLFADAIVQRRYDTVDDVSFYGLVDSRGLIHEYRLTYTVRNGKTTTYVTRSVRYRAVGHTTVTQPPWYENATANTLAS